MTKTDQYQIPQCVRIARGPDTERLYRLETKMTEAIRLAALELSNVLGDDPRQAQYWTRTLPLELFTVLESFDHRASIAAALGYLAYYRARDPQTVAELEAKVQP